MTIPDHFPASVTDRPAPNPDDAANRARMTARAEDAWNGREGSLLDRIELFVSPDGRHYMIDVVAHEKTAKGMEPRAKSLHARADASDEDVRALIVAGVSLLSGMVAGTPRDEEHTDVDVTHEHVPQWQMIYRRPL